MIPQVIQQLSNFFLDPLGLAALAGIIPLIIFYLMRPSPEEKIMPSMKFFQQDKKSGRLQKALNILQRNLMLLLHILMIVGLAAAIANPFIMQDQRPEKSVLVIDNSASMKPVFDQVKSEAESNIGQQNTIILVNDEVDLKAEKVSASKARRIIGDLKVQETDTRILRGIREARRYEGELFVASDLDETTEGSSVMSLLQEISAARPVGIYSPTKYNNWGIVDLSISRDNATVYVQNYLRERADIRIDVGEDTQELIFEPRELKKVSFTLEKGRNTVQLESDGFKTDNNAYLYRPRRGDTKVTLIADENNRYLMKAFELMEGVNATFIEPGDEMPESDVYIIGESENLEDIDQERLSSEVRSGKGLVLYAQKDLEDLSLPESPVKSVGEAFNSSVDINEPSELKLGNISMLRTEFNGESVSTPEEAVAFADYGSGEVMYYNVGSDLFRNDLMYPVFWKEAVNRLAERPEMEELNVKTGSTVLTEDKVLEIEKTGFKEISGTTYSANLLDADESSFENPDTDKISSENQIEKPRSIRFVPILAVLFLGLAELAYLNRKGELS